MKMMSMLLLSSVVILGVFSVSVIDFASASDGKEPKFLNIQTPCNGVECYFGTQRPTVVIFDVNAVDAYGNDIKVECDEYSGHIFPVGKTKVHCMAKDASGYEIRGHFVVTVGYNVVQIPSWFKHSVGYWLDGFISSDEYFHSLEFMLKKDIIEIPSVGNLKNTKDIEIPSWVIRESEKWYDGYTGNHEFSITIQWLIENGFVKNG